VGTRGGGYSGLLPGIDKGAFITLWEGGASFNDSEMDNP